MSVIKSVRPRKFLAALSVLFMVVGALFGANVASADSVQYQSYQRASQTEACAAQVGETPWQASWGADSSWKPSWEQWANNGKGGWTCGRSITWARDSATRTYALGDIGPGGGLVFLISGGLTYEMAPKAWGAGESGLSWCDTAPIDVVGTNTAVGKGAANTVAMAASGSCGSNAAAAVLAYAPTGSSAGQWFLPSKDELNAMCNYSRSPSSPALPSVSCYGTAGSTQDTTFASSAYGFTISRSGVPNSNYWSSSQDNSSDAWYQDLSDGQTTGHADKAVYALRVRPVRAF